MSYDLTGTFESSMKGVRANFVDLVLMFERSYMGAKRGCGRALMNLGHNGMSRREQSRRQLDGNTAQVQILSREQIS